MKPKLKMKTKLTVKDYLILAAVVGVVIFVACGRSTLWGLVK